MNKSYHFINRSIHQNNKMDDFRTPKYLFSFIENKFGPIHYDGACTPSLNNLAQPLKLENKWPSNSTIYSNPPFDSVSIIKWINKGHEHTKNGGTHILLLPNKLCQVFFNELFPMIDHIIYFGGRVDFSSPYSCKGGTSMSGSILLIQYPPSAKPKHIKIENFLLRDLKKTYKEGFNE